MMKKLTQTEKAQLLARVMCSLGYKIDELSDKNGPLAVELRQDVKQLKVWLKELTEPEQGAK